MAASSTKTDGMAMDSPLFLVTANFYMEEFELALKWATHKPVCWFQYKDDTFVIWPHGHKELKVFPDHLNSVYWNISFTIDRKRWPPSLPGRYLQETR
jgi:hypothetical protein